MFRSKIKKILRGGAGSGRAHKDPLDEHHISNVMKKAGWNRRLAEKRMKHARSAYGISYADFDRYSLFAVQPEDLEKEAAQLRELKSAEEAQRAVNVRSVAERSGMSEEEARADMEKAWKYYGVSFMEYDIYDLFRFRGRRRRSAAKSIIAGKEPIDGELKEIFEEIDSAGGSELKKPDKRYVASVMRKTGWDADRALAEMNAAYEEHKVRFVDYDRFDFHMIPEKYYDRVVGYAEDKRSLLKLDREVNMIAFEWASGCSHEEAYELIHSAKKTYGITSSQVLQTMFYDVPEEERAEIAAECRLEKIRDEDHKIRFREQKYRAIMEATGWDYETAVDRYLDTYYRTGVQRGDYVSYKMYDMTPEEQESMLLPVYSYKIRLRYFGDPKFKCIVRDKEATNIYFSDFLRRKWCVNTKVTEKEFLKTFRGVSRIIYKPLRGHKGSGIESFDLTKDAGEVYRRLRQYPIGVVEEYIVQHPVLSSISPTSVNTLRIVSISSSEKPVTADGKMMDIAYAALRIGGSDSIVDNIHSGGMAVAVDVETGEIVTDAVDFKGNVITEHPKTGVRFKGLKVPFFREAIEFVGDAIRQKNVQGYYGWDVAITEKGPMLIEVNSAPGVVLLTAPYAPMKIGKKYVMEKYMY